MVKTHIINPSTGRRVKIGTPTYYKVIKNTTTINPLTGRLIKIGSATHRKFMKLKKNVDDLNKEAQQQLADTNERNEKAKKLLLKLDIDEFLRDAKKQMNEQQQAIQANIKKVEEADTKIVMVPMVNNVSFKHALKTYIIKPSESNKYNYEQFINDMAFSAKNVMTKELKIKRGIRAQFTLLVTFTCKGLRERKH